MNDKKTGGCYDCIHFSEFIKPRKCDEINFIYGYCFKRPGIGYGGYSVYLPHGRCKECRLKKDEETTYE